MRMDCLVLPSLPKILAKTAEVNIREGHVQCAEYNDRTLELSASQPGSADVQPFRLLAEAPASSAHARRSSADLGACVESPGWYPMWNKLRISFLASATPPPLPKVKFPPPSQGYQPAVKIIERFRILIEKALRICYLAIRSDPDFSFIKERDAFLFATIDAQSRAMEMLKKQCELSEPDEKYLNELSGTLQDRMQTSLETEEADLERYHGVMQQKDVRGSAAEAGKRIAKIGFLEAIQRTRRDVFLKCVQPCLKKLDQLELGSKEIASPSVSLVILDVFQLVYWNAFANWKADAGAQCATESDALYAAHDEAIESGILEAVEDYTQSAAATDNKKKLREIHKVLNEMGMHLASDFRRRRKPAAGSAAPPPQQSRREQGSPEQSRRASLF